MVRQVRDGLALCGIPVWQVKERLPGASMSEAGLPDLQGYVPGGKFEPVFKCACPVPLYIEMKRPGRHRRRPEQVAFIDRAKADGCIALFATGWDDVSRELRSRGVVLRI